MICKALKRLEDALREMRIRGYRDRMCAAPDWRARRWWYSRMVDEIHARSEDQLQRMARKVVVGEGDVL